MMTNLHAIFAWQSRLTRTDQPVRAGHEAGFAPVVASEPSLTGGLSIVRVSRRGGTGQGEGREEAGQVHRLAVRIDDVSWSGRGGAAWRVGRCEAGDASQAAATQHLADLVEGFRPVRETEE